MNPQSQFTLTLLPADEQKFLLCEISGSHGGEYEV
jgi:hypothetical protein